MTGVQDRTSGSKSSDLDMTSMVDVTFLLLIFFMVTASFRLQKSIEVPSQHSEAGTAVEWLEMPQINVQVDQHGSYLVMTPHWELETPGKHNLIAALKQAVSESSQPALLAIDVHGSAKLESLVDVLDAGAAAGLANIQVKQSD